MKGVLSYFSRFEWGLLLSSIAVGVLSELISGSGGVLSLVASVVGAFALIFTAKGNPLGQLLFIVFGVLYGIISYTFAYYGEMITYLGMSVPMAVVSLVSWLRHPSDEGRSEVKVGGLKRVDALLLPTLTVGLTVLFYFILKLFGTANLLPSTLSVTTSFVAVYLTFRRSPWYAFAYALNDIVLILLWMLAALADPSYLAVVVCFLVFLVNDAYGFINWRRMRKKQTDM